jgi:hypothetical protein
VKLIVLRANKVRKSKMFTSCGCNRVGRGKAPSKDAFIASLQERMRMANDGVSTSRRYRRRDNFKGCVDMADVGVALRGRSASNMGTRVDPDRA